MRRGHALPLLLLCAAAPAAAKRKKEMSFPGIRPHIGCQVCNEAVKNIHRRVKDLREEKAGQKLREERIIEIMEHSCHPKREEGRWMRYFDLEVKGEKVKLVDKGVPGKLKKKHTSIGDACMYYAGGDAELSSLLYKDRKRGKVQDAICVAGGDSGEKGPCHKRFKVKNLRPKVLKQITDEEFIEVDQKELDAEKMVAEMGGMPGGMPEEALQMYSRDNVDEMAIDELVKEGMDEDEAAEMFKKMKAEGMFNFDDKGDAGGGEAPPPEDDVSAEDAAADAEAEAAAADGEL